MKLRDYLKGRSDFVYVGSNTGSGYLYIGNADRIEDTFREEREELYKAYSAESERWKKAKEKAMCNLDIAEKKKGKCKYEFQERNNDKAIELYKKRIELDKTHELDFKAKADAERNKMCWLDAEVVETYKRRFVKPLGECILIYYITDQNSGYWDIEEYENRTLKAHTRTH